MLPLVVAEAEVKEVFFRKVVAICQLKVHHAHVALVLGASRQDVRILARSQQTVVVWGGIA